MLHPTPFRSPAMPRLVMLVSALTMGMALAQPPDRRPSPDGPAAPADDDLSQIAADELGTQIRQLERHLLWMKKWATFRKDAETVAAVEAIQKKLAVAKDTHRDLCRLCEQRLHDTPAAIACCQQVEDVMYEVIEDHLALMRRLHTLRTQRKK